MHPKRTVLFYPDLPASYTVAFRACIILGYRMTNELSKHWDSAHLYQDATRVDLPESERLALGRAINVQCTDISKHHVQTVFERKFGYSLEVDPGTFEGHAVCKSDLNYAHDGVIVECPSPRTASPGVVYQRLVDADLGNGYCLDYRVPICGGDIPFVYLKYRPVDDRFRTYSWAEMAETSAILTPEEVQTLIGMARAMELDFGEMDVLRDRNDGRIYVVDVNHTPSGPPKKMERVPRREAAHRLADSYAQLLTAFGDKRSVGHGGANKDLTVPTTHGPAAVR